jgi:hypothetical protein
MASAAGMIHERALAISVSGFANGCIVIGVADDGEVLGCEPGPCFNSPFHEPPVVALRALPRGGERHRSVV